MVALALSFGCTAEVGPRVKQTKPQPGAGGDPVPGGGATGSGNAPGGGGGVSGTGNAPGTGNTPGTGSVSGTGGAITVITPTKVLDSGRVVLRRLNKTEYNNTVRDLLGSTTAPADTFPSDFAGRDGFDTSGVVLSFSDALFESVEAAGNKLIDDLVARPATDPLRTKVLLCQPTAATLSTCLTQILNPFMKNAYRRPVTAAEVQDLVALAMGLPATATDPMRGVSAALKTVLLSPHFLFHVEIGDPASKAAKPISEYELASRLSYFLWSTMPDAALMQAADAAKLTAAGGADLGTQITRMLADAKAQALTDNFAGQWLEIKNWSAVSPDAVKFKGKFDEALRLAIPKEANAFFASLIKENQPLTQLLLADYTFADARMAQHYGLPAGGATFAKVSLAGTPRVGLLTQEMFLTTTSFADRTSPVKRGNFVLEKILCDPTPPPPPNIPDLAVTPTSGTVRSALEAHRANAFCASCHDYIDPMGVPFENFDAIGAYQTMDNGSPIVTSTTLKGGQMLNGPKELATFLANDKRFAACVMQQALTYAVGRSFDTQDGKNYVAGISEPFMGKGTWPELLKTVATSEAFLTRRGEGP
ncbi:MAG: DUF1592 domain-containing protein, partial [Bacteroidota bacterium]